MVPITVTMQWKIDIMNTILCNKDLGGMNDILQPIRSLFIIFRFHCSISQKDGQEAYNRQKCFIVLLVVFITNKGFTTYWCCDFVFLLPCLYVPINTNKIPISMSCKMDLKVLDQLLEQSSHVNYFY